MNEKRWSEMHSKRITITLDDFEDAAARVLAEISRKAPGTTGMLLAMSIMPFEAELAHRLFEPEHFADEDEAKMDEVRDADREEKTITLRPLRRASCGHGFAREHSAS